MAETHIDNTSAGFVSTGSQKKIAGKSFGQKMRLCCKDVVLIPAVFLVLSIYAHYELFTDAVIVSSFMLETITLSIVGHVCIIALLKMTLGNEFKEILRQIFAN